MPGVVYTHSAWAEGAEIVEVRYDPGVTSTKELLAQAKKIRRLSRFWACEDAQIALAEKQLDVKRSRYDPKLRPAKPSDRRYHLRRSLAWFLPMLDVQAVRANAWLAAGKSLAPLLGPEQRELLAKLEKLPEEKREALRALDPARSRAAWAAYERRLRELLAAE